MGFGLVWSILDPTFSLLILGIIKNLRELYYHVWAVFETNIRYYGYFNHNKKQK